MKLRVVGWVYPYYTFEEGEVTWSVRNAIIDEIKKHGYFFSGEAHQDYACTPVLNNGKKYLFSRRGWGDIMAEAHGYTGCMDYTLFDMSMFLKNMNLPHSSRNEFDEFLYSDEYDFDKNFEDWFEDFIDKSEETKKILRESYRHEQRWLIPETDLSERFELVVTQETLDSAQNKKIVKLDITPKLRYLDGGDTLALACNGIIEEFTVVNVERKRDLTESELSRLKSDMYSSDREKAKQAQEEFDNAKMILVIKLEKTTN